MDSEEYEDTNITEEKSKSESEEYEETEIIDIEGFSIDALELMVKAAELWEQALEGKVKPDELRKLRASFAITPTPSRRGRRR